MRFQLTLYKTFCPTPLPLTHRQSTPRNLMLPLILNTNFTKRELKTGYLQDLNLGSHDWKHVVITTDWEPAEWESPYWKPAAQLMR